MTWFLVNVLSVYSWINLSKNGYPPLKKFFFLVKEHIFFSSSSNSLTWWLPTQQIVSKFLKAFLLYIV